MTNTHFSPETSQSVMVMYENRIEALLSNIKFLEMQLDHSLKMQDENN